MTSEGYAASAAGFAAHMQWRIAGKAVDAESVWKTLRQPEAVAKAAHGEKLESPIFGK